jgi:inorganic triphosphatase YgiF
MPVEIELKYSLDEAVARQLLTLRRLGAYALTPFDVKTVIDVYYDTSDRSIARTGYALRFRRKGDNASLQLKSLSPAAGSWHRRRELHISTPHPTEPERWPDTPEADFLREILGQRSLQSLFTIHQQRHEARVLDAAGAPLALLSLDEVRWQAGKREQRAWELEIELLPQGNEALLQALAEALRAMPGLHPQARSKYERGMALLGDQLDGAPS